MSSFDFSMYDLDDISSPIKEKKSKKEPEKKPFDFSMYEEEPSPKKSLASTIKSYGKTALKGAIEGISSLGRMMGPLETGVSTEEQLKAQSEVLNKLFPTEESFGQESLRRGLKIAPSAMAFPGAPLQAGARSLAAGVLGETAKELGAPEWAQTASELTAFIGPDLTKKLLESGKNEKLIQFAKKMGLTDEQITPLIQSETKQKWLTKLAPKRGSTEKVLSETKKALDQTYGSLQKSPEAALNLPFEQSEKFQEKISDILFKMPASVRNKIKEDLADLYSAPITGDSLINFYTDINHYLGDNAKQLSLLKQPIKEALSEISPSLSKDFEMVNQLYTKYFPIANRLKPNLMSDLIGAGKAISLFAGIVTGNYGLIAEFPLQATIQKGAQKLLLSPRFQQMARKTIEALNSNKFSIVKKMAELYAQELDNDFPEASKELRSISEKELEDALK